MPYRRTIFAQDQIYHVFNRGVARLPIFSMSRDFHRLIELISYYRFLNTPLSFSHLKKLTQEEKDKIFSELTSRGDFHVEILAFCLMENHIHFLLKQISKDGIPKFVSNLQNSYAKYFNIKTDRNGPLFQPMFKAAIIETEEQLLHVSRYIHLNPSTGYVVDIKDLEDYSWSSLKYYLTGKPPEYAFVSTKLVLDLIGGVEEYKKFIFDQADYQRKLAKIKHLMIE